MRLRSSSIRARIIALLMVPIVALAGLWIYATLVTTGDVWNQLHLSATYKAFGGPIDQYARDLQAERRAAVLKLVLAPGSNSAAAAFQQAQEATDRDLRLLRDQAGKNGSDRLDADQLARFQGILAKADMLAGVRGRTRDAQDAWDHVLVEYSDVIQPVFTFRSSLISNLTGQVPRQGTILIELLRAREFLSQEAAAMEGLRLTPDPDPGKLQTALDALHSQQALFRIYVGELGLQDQRDYLDLQNSESWDQLNAAEQRFEDAADRIQQVKSDPVDPWGDHANQVLTDLSELDTRLASGIGETARAYAVQSLVRGGIAGAVGLAAVLLSLFISSRIGRRLARELVGLRNAALETSGTRLPSVMLRLRRGEAVDVAAEVPQLDFGAAEIGQVGRAFNEVQRVAVEAAVEQADLRRGVSAVFVNLARRSQVLLHRQLTLLDTMERRTEDPTELEDLFRLDHLTTRMRRHSEGLIILSGGSPGRAWRRPVRMVDVVRAAIGEVEDYARVVVRPFPGTGLLGSAVADVTHLIAELVENAAVFSPPHTQITVQGEVVAHGFCLEIDDRGLGLSEHALQEINERLEVEQEFDLADTDRLGLFVVSRLARRHGIRVHLRPSPYGGTSAVVLIPRELLADLSDLTVDQVHLRSVVEGDQPVRPTPGQTGGPRPSAVEPARTPGGLPRRRAAGSGPVLVSSSSHGGTGRHRRADSPEEDRPAATNPAHAAPPHTPEPSPAPAAASASAPQPAVAGGLPRRVRQANLAPQLKDATDGAAAEPTRERSPEEARATFASFQRGFQRGRGDRLQPASLTVVRKWPGPEPATPPPAPARLRAALPSAPVPAALPAARSRTGHVRPAVEQVPTAQEPPAAQQTLTEQQPPAVQGPPVRQARPEVHGRPVVQARPAEPAPAEGTES